MSGWPERPRPAGHRRLAAWACLGTLTATFAGGCSGSRPGPAHPSAAVTGARTGPRSTESTGSLAGQRSAAGSPVPAACPSRYADPDPHRPDVRLTFDLAADHASVTGTERVAFRPDRAVTELVFRQWPDNPVSRRDGAAMSVDSATVAVDRAPATPTTPNSSVSDPTIVSLALPARAAAGSLVTASLRFRVTLPPAGFDRLGHTARTAWWGTGFPLLAWVAGVGWATEPAATVPSESVTSEAARTDVTVLAPAADTVLTTGRADPPVAAGTGRRRWHAVAAAARDVSVAAAAFRLRRTSAGGVPVTVGVAPELTVDPSALSALTLAALRDHVARFGPFPFEALAVAALPGIGGGGVEYPGAVQVGSLRLPLVLSHELAHEWFYGLVGNDQARDPWLDEAFATYVQVLQQPQSRAGILPALGTSGRVGAPTRSFDADPRAYARVVYGKGAAALLTARDRAGPAAFDAAIGCYVRANAYRVARPADLARALGGLPAALAVLRSAGALPPA